MIFDGLDQKVQAKIYFQKYKPQAFIDKVKIIEIDFKVDEEGDFSEILRINDNNEVEGLPGFKILQANRSRLFPRAVKAWHLHLKQDELWYVVSQDHLLVGLWDIRKKSPTNGKVMRLIMGGGKSQLLFIPKGVAHGSANLIDHPVTMWYFTNQRFNLKNPDEGRISWDAIGADFWKPLRD